jgi:hypothetical protein
MISCVFPALGGTGVGNPFAAGKSIRVNLCNLPAGRQVRGLYSCIFSRIRRDRRGLLCPFVANNYVREAGILSRQKKSILFEDGLKIYFVAT